MRPRVVAIFVAESGWSLGLVGDEGASLLPVDIDPSASPADRAAAVRAAADGAGAECCSVVLALPATWCFAAAVTTDGVIRRNRHAALLFRLEEFLPLDAETLTADFVGSGHHALGVAVQSDRVLPIIEALEAEDIDVCSIGPTPLLALQQLVQANADETEAFVLVEDGRFDLFEWHTGHPASWRHGVMEADPLRRHIERVAWQREDALPLAVVAEEPPAVADLLKTDGRMAITEVTASAKLVAIDAARRIVNDGIAPLIELRRDRLAMKDRLTRVKTPLRFAAAAIAFLLISVTVVTLWRGHQYETHAADLLRQQEDLFRGAFPGQDVPLMVLARFRSEHRRLSGMSGLSGDLPEQTSALSTLHQALTSLPGDMRYRVLELRLDPNRIYLDGQARSHGDADLIAASLRRNGAFTLEPPRTENLPDQGGTSGGGGVVFTLTGTPGNPASVPGSTPASAPGPRKSPPKTAPGEQTTEQHQEMARASDAGDTP